MLGRGLNVTPPRILKRNILVIYNINFNKNYRVSKGISPRCVKLNFPATGQRTGTGYLDKNKSYFHLPSLLNDTHEQTV